LDDNYARHTFPRAPERTPIFQVSLLLSAW